MNKRRRTSFILSVTGGTLIAVASFFPWMGIRAHAATDVNIGSVIHFGAPDNLLSNQNAFELSFPIAMFCSLIGLAILVAAIFFHTKWRLVKTNDPFWVFTFLGIVAIGAIAALTFGYSDNPLVTESWVSVQVELTWGALAGPKVAIVGVLAVMGSALCFKLGKGSN